MHVSPANIAMCDYQESVTTRQTDKRMDKQMPDKVIPLCNYASQATQLSKVPSRSVKIYNGYPIVDYMRLYVNKQVFFQTYFLL